MFVDFISITIVKCKNAILSRVHTSALYENINYVFSQTFVNCLTKTENYCNGFYFKSKIIDRSLSPKHKLNIIKGLIGHIFIKHVLPQIFQNTYFWQKNLKQLTENM